jgi:hypothetical protein
MNNQSRTFQLIEMKLGRPLVDHAREMRQRGASWHSITLDLANRTDVAVTPETLRLWLVNEPGMARGRATA